MGIQTFRYKPACPYKVDTSPLRPLISLIPGIHSSFLSTKLLVEVFHHLDDVCGTAAAPRIGRPWVRTCRAINVLLQLAAVRGTPIARRIITTGGQLSVYFQAEPTAIVNGTQSFPTNRVWPGCRWRRGWERDHVSSTIHARAVNTRQRLKVTYKGCVSDGHGWDTYTADRINITLSFWVPPFLHPRLFVPA
ncbi:hypothetical protein TEQG_03730 [Trichophyton equinum CBS 127.97]|uniref:Uncharacterized protein n=1 Tax=Trichophyton equinum (strain ATCC MYA-4606 / CBS 127.97) TaxID=559882 RepID=F2PSL9_TRIEC|nr:hypothetical protein TEQG_03730 [Trichophyton equinum CBS 127.97]